MLSRNPGMLPNTLSICRCDQISRIGMRRIQVLGLESQVIRWLSKQ
jgi:hypothetical protein